MFNNELQRSEKMEIISELAIGCAFVTRRSYAGIPALSHRKACRGTRIFDLALVELDRASGIITDFLTFAKPEFGKDTGCGGV